MRCVGGTCTMPPPSAAQRPAVRGTEPTLDEPYTRMGAGTESPAPRPLSRVTSAGRKLHPGAAEPFDPGYDGRERRSQAGGGLARIKPQSFLHLHGCSKVPSQPWSSLGIGGRSAEPCPGCPPAWSHSAVRSTCTSPCHTLGGHCDRTRRLGGNASIGYSDRNSAVTDGVHIPRTVG